MRILLVEDAVHVASFIAKGLGDAGYTTEVVGAGTEAIQRLGQGDQIDMILLDVGLPDIDGFRVLEEIRKHDQYIPVIMLTAYADVASRVKGLDLGADDYLPKPFDFDELLARVRAALRHSRQPQAAILRWGEIVLDLKTRQVTVSGRRVDLTSREFALLEFLLRHEGQLLTRSQLLGGVWGYDFDPQSNVVDVYVGYLRNKLGLSGEESPIETVRGGGYRLRSFDSTDLA